MARAGDVPRNHKGHECFVYFARAACGSIKIGHSTNPWTAVIESGRWTPVPHRLVAVMRGNATTERGLHDRFRAANIRGEWFRPTPELVALVGAIPAWVRP